MAAVDTPAPPALEQVTRYDLGTVSGIRFADAAALTPKTGESIAFDTLAAHQREHAVQIRDYAVGMAAYNAWMNENVFA